MAKWTELERSELVRCVDESRERDTNKPMRDIFRELAEKFGRSYSSLNYAYYQEKRKSRSEKIEQPKEDVILTSLGNLVEDLSSIESIDTESFIKGFATIVKRASESGLSSEVERLKREKEDLKTQLESTSIMQITSEDVVKELKDKLSLIFKLVHKFHNLEPARKMKYISNLTWGISCIITDKEWKAAEPLSDYKELETTLK